MNIIIIFLTILFLLPNDSFAATGYYEDCYYETRDRISISVSGRVSKDKDKGIFLYSYSVKSNPQSEQDVYRFRIILPEKSIVIDATAPDGWRGPGWSGKPTKYGHLRQSELPPPYSIGWIAPQGNRIEPSGKVSGFAFKTSFGLPGIVAYYAEGYAPLPRCPEGGAVNFIPGYDDLTPYGPGIVGRTIGPTAPPTPFMPIEFLDYIISLKHEAYSLGWIKNAGIEQSLDAKLDNAKKKIEQGNIEAAKNILNAFINEVEAQGCVTYDDCSSGKHISPEAYALLKYNVQYLIEKIQ